MQKRSSTPSASSSSRTVPVYISVPAAPLFAMSRPAPTVRTNPRPTSKDVICGIAPHVFDERRKKSNKKFPPGVRPAGQHSKQPKLQVSTGRRTLKSSPLRFSVLITVERDCPIVFMEPQPSSHHHHLHHPLHTTVTQVDVVEPPKLITHCFSTPSTPSLVSTSNNDNPKSKPTTTETSPGKSPRPRSRLGGFFLSRLDSTRIFKHTDKS